MSNNKRSVLRCLAAAMFLLYLLLMVYFLFFSESYGRGVREGGLRHYNLRPFYEIRRFLRYHHQLGLLAVLTNVLGNVLAFVPLGVFLPLLVRLRGALPVILAGFALSLAVEFIQLFTRVGVFDVDDLMLNTVGTALGYGLYLVQLQIRRWIHGKKI